MNKFVKITREGVTLAVSLLVVEDHKRLGWKVLEEDAVSAETPGPVDPAAHVDPAAELKEDKSKGEGKS